MRLAASETAEMCAKFIARPSLSRCVARWYTKSPSAVKSWASAAVNSCQLGMVPANREGVSFESCNDHPLHDSAFDVVRLRPGDGAGQLWAPAWRPRGYRGQVGGPDWRIGGARWSQWSC